MYISAHYPCPQPHLSHVWLCDYDEFYNTSKLKFSCFHLNSMTRNSNK